MEAHRHLYQVLGRKHFPLPLAGLNIKLTGVRLIGGKKIKFDHVYGGPIMKLRPKENNQGRLFLHFLGKETINLWGIDKTEKTYVHKLLLVRNCKQHLG